jgi:hypothetical protein
LLLGLNINDFLTLETVDARTAMKVLADGGLVKWGNEHVLRFVDGLGFQWCECPEKDDWGLVSVHLDCKEYEVISWGDYKDE